MEQPEEKKGEVRSGRRMEEIGGDEEKEGEEMGRSRKDREGCKGEAVEETGKGRVDVHLEMKKTQI